MHDFRPYEGPDVPTNWLEPVNYADGTYTLTLEIVEMTDAMAVPFYYTVGFKAGSDASPASYARAAFKVEDPNQIYEKTRPVKGIQKVVDGVDAGGVGDDWDWTDPFDHPRGDMWGTTFPIKVKVKMVVHPAVESTGLYGLPP